MIAATDLPPFVSPEWLVQHHHDVVVADVRWYLDGRDGRADYLDGHLPDAVFVDLDRDLAAAAGGTAGRHPLPPPEAFAAALGRLGISAEDAVVAYDQGIGATAARLVWMLRVLGQPAAVLDGGLEAWPGPLAAGDVRRPVTEVPVRPWPGSVLVEADDVAALAARDDAVVIDARAPARYRGEVEPVDPRPGHVPGAVNVPFAGNAGADGRLLPLDDLRRRFEAVGAGDATDVAVYCGSGVTACHDVLALEALGVGARLYVGSWSGWSSDPDRPAATGDAPR